MSDKIVISSKEGQIRGIKQLSKFSNTEFYSFFGVPYGKPPIGRLRFKDPIRASPWQDVLDATSETKEGCKQFSLIFFRFLGSEDCLFNNIYIPKLPKKNDTLRPVIVNIHPGAYSFGTPTQYNYGSPEFVMHTDIVYVCVSFRLHILGFLNLGLKECSGNQGIKDILLSLKWIKDNIQSFGGDPNNVTLLGSSSGANIINVLMLSPSAKGLFHKAVMMGAYFLTPCPPYEETNERHAAEIAKFLCYQKDPQDRQKLLSFLKMQKAELLIEGCRRCQRDLQQLINRVFHVTVYRPHISPYLNVFSPSFDRGEILPEWPRKLIKSMARIPLMIGFSQIESALGFIRTIRPLTEKNFKVSMRQNCFGWGAHLTDDDLNSIDQETKTFYYNEQSFEKIPLRVKMDIQNDIILSDVYDTVIDPISTDLPSSVFVYKFEFEGNILSMNDVMRDQIEEPVKGTFHGSDFCYWNKFGDPEDDKAHEMVETFTKLIATFARTGDPNYENLPVKWRPSTPDNPCYLSINDTLEMVDGKLNDRLGFWDGIKKKYTTE